jgi:hypothetical protein
VVRSINGCLSLDLSNVFAPYPRKKDSIEFRVLRGEEGEKIPNDLHVSFAKRACGTVAYKVALHRMVKDRIASAEGLEGAVHAPGKRLDD